MAPNFNSYSHITAVLAVPFYLSRENYTYTAAGGSFIAAIWSIWKLHSIRLWMRCLFSEFYQSTLNSTFTTQVNTVPLRQSFSVGEKNSLIKKLHKSNQSLPSFCEENSIPQGSFQGFLKLKDELLNDGGDICRKRNSKGRHVILEDACSLWVLQKN